MLNRMCKRLKTFGQLLKRLAHSRSGLSGMVILGFWIAICVVTLFWIPYEPTTFHYTSRLRAPSSEFLLGTDHFGRDILSRVLAGSEGVLLVSLSGTLIGLILGTLVGLTSGYFGGVYDEITMRFMDILMSFPSLLLAMLVLGMLGPSLINVVFVMGIVFAPRMARVVRSAVLDIKFKEFVEAARSNGESQFHIMVAELLPNILGPLGVEFSVRFALGIFLSASLGFLGLGVQPPAPDWGLMVSEGRDYILVAPWIVISPCLALCSLVIGVNLFSDGIRQLAAGEV